METVSIIVPVYNRANVIGRCVESIRAQTYRDLEILLCDDGSEDGTRQLLFDYARNDSRICIAANCHRGASAARNSGLLRASGAYIGFLDSDDVLSPDAIERMYTDLSETGAELACCRFRLEENADAPFTAEPGSSVVMDPWTAFERMLINDGIRGYGVSPGTKLCRRETVMCPTPLLYEEGVHFGEDTMWIAGVLARCKRVVMDSSVLMRYSFDCENSLCRNADTLTRLRHARWKRSCLEAHGCSEEAIAAIRQEESQLTTRLLLGFGRKSF